jgi:hypothetical protein
MCDSQLVGDNSGDVEAENAISVLKAPLFLFLGFRLRLRRKTDVFFVSTAERA